MSNGAKVALAVGAGYLLGRTRKMKLALMLAGAGITGKFPARPADLAAAGLQSLGGSGQLSQLREQLRDEVLAAAKSAALTAVTHQVDSLNDRLQGVTSSVGADEVLEDVGSGADEVLDEVGSTVGDTVDDTLNVLGGRRRTRREDDRYLDEDDAYDELEDEDQEPLDVDEMDGDAGEDIDDETDMDREPELEEGGPQAPIKRRRATRRATAPRTSVRRSTRAASSEEPAARAARHQRAAAPANPPVRRGR